MSEWSELAINAARALCRGNLYISAHGRLYRYVHGVFVDCEDVVRPQAQRILGGNSTRSQINEVIHWLCNEYRVDPDLLNPSGVINVRNGLLIPTTGDLAPHSPNLLSTIQLPVEWHADAYHQRADEFLDQVLPSPETRLLIEEVVGYCLLGDCRYEKALMLSGVGANGKSTFIRWLTATLGRENISSVSLQDLNKERFRLAPIVGKLANTFADLSREALKDTASFKALVSGDELTAEWKYRNPFKFRNRAKLIFSANELPHSSDQSEAFFRRWVIVPFPHAFPEGDPRRDPHLGAELETPEAGAYLLRLGVEGLRRLIANGAFTKTPETIDALLQYRRDVDSVRSFVEEHCLVGSGHEVRRDQLYATYREQTERAGLRPVGLPLFGRRLRELVPGIDEYQPRDGDARPRYYVGIGERVRDSLDRAGMGE